MYFMQDEKSNRMMKFERIVQASKKLDVVKIMQDAPKNYELMLLLKNLHKRYGSTDAVKEMDLSMFKNQLFVLAGHEKSGKTTTLCMISGMCLYFVRYTAKPLECHSTRVLSNAKIRGLR